MSTTFLLVGVKERIGSSWVREMCGTGGWRAHKGLLKYCGLAAKIEKGGTMH